MAQRREGNHPSNTELQVTNPKSISTSLQLVLVPIPLSVIPVAISVPRAPSPVSLFLLTPTLQITWCQFSAFSGPSLEQFGTQLLMNLLRESQQWPPGVRGLQEGTLQSELHASHLLSKAMALTSHFSFRGSGCPTPTHRHPQHSSGQVHLCQLIIERFISHQEVIAAC